MNEHRASPGVPQPGDILLDKYRIDRVLGRGGMGVVLAATHLQLDDRFAIKFLLPQTLEQPDLVRRFLREAQASTRIRSEHIVRVFDVGTLPSGMPYMVMEYLDGLDLGDILESSGPLSVAEAVDDVLQACEAIAEAHAMGIVHRDLKPANLFVTRRAGGGRVVKVLDFGISKVDSGSGPQLSLTHTSQVMGSPRYMSPEQMRSTRAADMRSDIWALGAILQELVTARPAFEADTLTELCVQILQDPCPRLRTLRPDAPQGLEDAIVRSLEKDPAARFQNVAQLARAIAPFGSGEAARSAEQIVRVLHAAGLDTTSPGHGSAAPGPDPSFPLASFGEPGPRASVPGRPPSLAVTTAHPVIASSSPHARKRSPVPWVLGVLVVLGAAAALAVVALRGASPPSPAASVERPTPPATEPAISVPVPVPAPPPASTPVQPNPSPALSASAADAVDATTPSSSPAKAAIAHAAPTVKCHPGDPRCGPPPTAKPAAAPTKAAPNCNPPFFFDASGNKVFKPECF